MKNPHRFFYESRSQTLSNYIKAHVLLQIVPPKEKFIGDPESLVTVTECSYQNFIDNALLIRRSSFFRVYSLHATHGRFMNVY